MGYPWGDRRDWRRALWTPPVLFFRASAFLRRCIRAISLGCIEKENWSVRQNIELDLAAFFFFLRKLATFVLGATGAGGRFVALDFDEQGR